MFNKATGISQGANNSSGIFFPQSSSLYHLYSLLGKARYLELTALSVHPIHSTISTKPNSL